MLKNFLCSAIYSLSNLSADAQHDMKAHDREGRKMALFDLSIAQKNRKN